VTSRLDAIESARQFLAALLSGTLLFVFAASLAAPAHAAFPDWEKYVDVEVIEILTQDEDGAPRETKVWFVLLSGVAFLRTSDSEWLANLRRDPDCGLRIEGAEYRARATEIPGEEIVTKIDTASVLKYGLQERLIHIFRMRKPDILELGPVPGGQ
jgi:hypothetical protein